MPERWPQIGVSSLLTERSSRDAYLKGAFILAGAAMFSRILGAIYRIPLGRVMGSYGMGLYGAGYAIYTTLIGISTVGINVAISKVMAEKLAHDDESGAHRVFGLSFALLSVAGLVSALALGLGAHPLADRVMRNPDAFYAILALSPALFLVALEGSLRGFFQGYQNMSPPAISQIVEQFFRVFSLLVLAYALLPRGDAIAAGGAASGAAIGAFVGVLYLLIPYSRARRRVSLGLLQPTATRPKAAPEPAKDILKRIIILAIPISIAGVVIPLMSLVDLAVVPTRLQAVGFSVREATALYGNLSQLAMALISLPAVVTYGLQTSLVPSISEAQALGDKAAIRSRTSTGIRATLIVALPAFLGLWILATPISGLLYNVPEAGVPLASLSAAVVFLMLQQTTSGVLQGLGRTDIPVRNLLIGAVIKAGLAWYLTGIPSLNIRGAGYSTVVGFLIASALNAYSVHRVVGFDLDWTSTVLKPLGASAVMGLVVYFGFPPLAAALGSNLAALVAVVVGGVAYGLALLLVGGIKERDFSFLPVIGQRLAKLLKGARLIRD